MKVTAVVLTDLPDTDIKEEQDAATAVDNICYERVPSKLNILHQHAIRYHVKKEDHTQAPALQVLGYERIWCEMANHSLLQSVNFRILKFSHIFTVTHQDHKF